MTALASVVAPTRLVPPDLGRCCWNLAARRSVVWSGLVYRLHGYQPGSVTPSVALDLQHKHPDDLHGCVDALHAGMVTGRLVVHEHRLVDADGKMRPVVMVARSVNDGPGRVRQLHGFLLPTDTADTADTAGTAPRRGRGAAPLIPVLRNAFPVGKPAAHLLLAARRSAVMWRTPSSRPYAVLRRDRERL